MKITLKKLTLLNFKGVRKVSITFNPDVTTISGDNGTGKTTLADAFNFLLFGKNSYGQKDFNIKTLDANNNPIHKLSHEVEGVFDIDGIEATFKRAYKEKWVKPKGVEIEEMGGHETLFYYNNVPLNQTEYKAKVESIIDEELMKLLTNPMYFNSIKWEDRRKILTDMTGSISDTETLETITTTENKEEAESLLLMLNSGKSADEYKRELSAKRKLLIKELSTIPTRIDEAERSMPMVENWSKINSDINSLLDNISELEKEIEDRNHAFSKQREESQKMQQEKHKLEIELSTLQAQNKLAGTKDAMQLDNDISVSKQKIENLKRQIDENNHQVSKQNNVINQLNSENDKLREQWNLENAKELIIDNDKLNCPACKQPLPEDDAENQKNILTTNFNGSKQGALHRIEQQGLSNKETITKSEKTIQELSFSNNALMSELKDEEAKLLELQSKQKDITSFTYVPTKEEDELQKKIDSIVVPELKSVDVSDIKIRKFELSFELDTLKMKLSNKEQIDKTNIRIEELKKQEKELSQEISNIERTEFLVQSLETEKINELDRRLTKLFPMVQFRLFKTLINGGTEPCCDLLVNGVPFNDVNTAGRINAGLSIINTLTDFYGKYCPIFIDQKEAINNPIPCKSQTIFLTVGNELSLTVK